MFPDTSGASDIGLEHCMRFLPHHQDSGGFFVSVLVKDRALDADAFGQDVFATLKSDGKIPANNNKGDEKDKMKKEEGDNEKAVVPNTVAGADVGVTAVATAHEHGNGEGVDTKRGGPTPEEEEAADVGPAAAEAPGADVSDATLTTPAGNLDIATKSLADEEPAPSEAFPRRGRWKGVDASNLIVDPDLLGSLTSCFGLSSDFNTSTRLIVRSVDPSARPKKIYSVSSSVARIIEDDPSEKLRIFACGVRMFERQDGKVRAT